MKKLILLLITLITLINVSYASFPVFESDSLVIEEMEPLTENFSGNYLYPILSLLFSLFGKYSSGSLFEIPLFKFDISKIEFISLRR